MEEKLKFAVFIDYDNIEIGVKSTLHREFDVDCVLEGLKERGEVVAKVSYGNWSRHGAAARAFSEHGVHMVQRDSTPRGDKNGADINLALDALEMAFTRDHINAFAIVSGDSDFMALVNKLKQYNKRVYIVGGKAFTSTILQRNCHEFISYESLLDTPSARSRRGGQAAQRSRPRRSLPILRAVPLIDRALRALELRGVQPQLGLLKSTMLQLDPVFTERDYGTSSFSTFVEKLVEQGFLSVQTVDGHYVVERKGEGQELESAAGASREDATKLLKEVLAANVELLVMGIPAREIRALVQAADPNFKETDYGFSEFAELLNLAGDKGLVRIEADPHHGFRYYPGDEIPHPALVAGAQPSSDAAEMAGLAQEETPQTSAGGARGRGRRRRRKPAEAAAARNRQGSAGSSARSGQSEPQSGEEDLNGEKPQEAGGGQEQESAAASRTAADESAVDDQDAHADEDAAAKPKRTTRRRRTTRKKTSASRARGAGSAGQPAATNATEK